MEIKKLSEHRTALMGLAILLIMFCHNSLYFPGAIGQMNSALKMLAQCGVDMFFFFSGMGCFYSLESRKVSDFYKKRVVRIFLPYLLIVGIYGMYMVGICHVNVGEFFSRYSLITFFTEAKLDEWFIAAIIVTYIMSPMFYKILKANTKWFLLLIAVVYCLCLSRLKFGPTNYRIIVDIWVSRIPAFLFGMLVGKYAKEEGHVSGNKKLCLIWGISILCVFMALYCFKFKTMAYWLWIRLGFLPIVISVITVYIKLLERWKVKQLQKVFVWLGGLTLEIYLLHEKILDLCNGKFGGFATGNVFGSIFVNLLAVGISIILAKLIHSLLTMKK